MGDVMTIDVISRWLHVGTAVVLLGGSVFMRFVLMPAAETLPEAEHAALRERVMGRWRKFVFGGIALLLVSGFYNYIRKIVGHQVDGPYHMWMGIKILLALGVFFLASALAGRSAAFENLRRDRKRWLLVTILLAFLVVAIGGYLRMTPRKPATDAQDAKPQTTAGRHIMPLRLKAPWHSAAPPVRA